MNVIELQNPLDIAISLPASAKRSAAISAAVKQMQSEGARRDATWDEARAAVRAAGVGDCSRIVELAMANGYTPDELISDAFVTRFCLDLGPGALLYRVRDQGRCWPVSGVPDAATLYQQMADQSLQDSACSEMITEFNPQTCKVPK